MGRACEKSSGALKVECSTCNKRSNLAKHRKVCGKNKLPKTRKAINRDVYVRNKDKILQKRFEQRVYERFRRLEESS
ncbi:hypothetical protein PRIC1_014254 [Phytophthora ramorum]|uniref:uncharacterized protein n=1 Tax=Phytophthora ramorum TaxID=164328 RepID=UPI0030ADE544|nr:hypothetical protein KRP23_288 [Phytophthora ramorum]